MREISPAVNATIEEVLNGVPPEIRAIAENIRAQKKKGTRPAPSHNLIDRSDIFDNCSASKESGQI